MVWIVIVALGAWVAYLANRLSDQSRRLDAVRRDLEALRAASVRPDMSNARLSVPVETQPAEPPPPDLAPRATVSPLAVFATPAPVQSESDAPAEGAAWTPAEPPPIAARVPDRPPINLAAWLSENGLAWLGGGALVLGGIFLVTYAAQKGVFTPMLRIWAAVAAGLAMVAASEWIRRLEDKDGRSQALPAAVAAGAGAATLYGAVWAADGLYHFIGHGPAAGLLALVSLGLLGLAWLHGGALALLALGGALIVPAITGPQDWSPVALRAYVSLVAATGYAAAGARRWGAAGLLAGLGAAFWAFISIAFTRDPLGGALLLAAPPMLALLAIEVAGRGAAAPETAPMAWMVRVALVASGVIGFLLWGGMGPGRTTGLATAVALALVATAAVAGVRRRAPPFIPALIQGLAVAGLGLAIGDAPEALRRELAAPALLLGLGLAAAGLGATWMAREPKDRPMAASGAVASALAFAVSALVLKGLAPQAPWIGPAGGALVLAFGAAMVARRSTDPPRDLTVALWIWASTAVAFQTLGMAFDPRALPIVLGVSAVAAAGLQMRLGWRGLPSAALASALAALAALLGPKLGGVALLGQGSPWLLAGVAAAAAALVAAAGLIARRGGHGRRDVADGLISGAILIALAGVFLSLHAFAAPSGGQRLDTLTEAALRTLMLLAAGLLARPGPDAGRLSRLRPHALLLAGTAHALVFAGVVLNPLWSGVPVAGPPLIDSLALAFLVPGVLLVAAARTVGTVRWTPAYALAGVAFAVVWGLEEIRRLCQGADFAHLAHALGRQEAAADALFLLAVACGLLALARRAPARTSAWTGLEARGLPAAASIALAFADLTYGYLASPWWGPIDGALSSLAAAVVLAACYAGGVGASLALSRLAADRLALARFALVSGCLQLFALLTLAIRFGFRGLSMGYRPGEAGFETWTFSAIWAVYGLGVMVVGVRRGDLALRWTGLGLLLFTTAKVLLFDMAHLDGMVRAASFLALGALLIVGALAARRLGAFGAARAEPED